MLNAFDPLSLVAGAVRPVHLAVALALIILVFALVRVSAGPLELPKATLLVVNVVAFVGVALGATRAAPLTFPVLHAFHHVAYVSGSRFPSVLAFSMRFPVDVVSCVGISVNKQIGASAVLETHVPLALVPIALLPSVNAIAMRLAIFPFANVAVVVNASPNSVPLLQSLVPLAIVDFTVGPGKDPFPVGLAFSEIAIITISVWIPFESFAAADINLPPAFILPTICVLHHTYSLAPTINHGSQKNSLGEPSLLKVIVFLQLFEVNFVRFQHNLVKLKVCRRSRAH